MLRTGRKTDTAGINTIILCEVIHNKIISQTSLPILKLQWCPGSSLELTLITTSTNSRNLDLEIRWLLWNDETKPRKKNTRLKSSIEMCVITTVCFKNISLTDVPIKSFSQTGECHRWWHWWLTDYTLQVYNTALSTDGLQMITVHYTE